MSNSFPSRKRRFPSGLTAELSVQVAATVSLTIGIGGLIASALGWTAPLQGFVGAPVMICDTALALALCGYGLLQALCRNRIACCIAGTAVSGLGAVHLFSHRALLPLSFSSSKTNLMALTGGVEPQMAPTTQVVFILFGAALLLLSYRLPRQPQLWIVAFIGSFIASSGCLGLLALLAGLGIDGWWSTLLFKQSLPAAIGACVLGTALCCLFWTHVRLRHRSVAIAIATLSLTGMLLIFAGADTAVVLSAHAVMQSRTAIAETFRKIKNIQTLVEAVRSSETGQRGFLLTAKPIYLRSYNSDVAAIRSSLVQLASYPHLTELVQQKMIELEDTIRMERSGRHEDAIRLIKTDQGLVLMEAIEREASAKIRLLHLELDDRNEEGRLSLSLVQKTVVLSYVAASLLTALALFLVGKELRRNSQQQKALRENEFSLERRVRERTEELTVEVAHRRGTEEQLRESELRFRSALASSKVATWTWTPADDLVLWAGPVRQIFACDPLQLSSYAAFRALIHPDDRDRIDEALTIGNGYDAEFRIIRPDGQIRWLAGRGDAVLEDSEIVLLTGVNFDITDRKLAEEACKRSESTLREQDRQLAMVFDSGSIGNWSYDIGQNMVVAHPTVWRLYGADPQTGAPWSWFAKRHHADDHAKIVAAFRSALRGTSNPDVEFRAVWPDGSLRWLSCRGNVTFNDVGIPVQVSGLVIDMTERKVNELELKRREENFRNLANAMPQIVWTARPDGAIDACNDRWYNFVGRRREEIGNEAFQSMLHPDDVSPASSCWAESIQTGKPFETELRFWDRIHNSYRWFLGRAIPNRDVHGKIVNWFGTCTDIHQQKAAEEILEAEVESRTKDLRQLLLEKETLLKELHHRVKNNLQVISSLLRMQSELVPEGPARTALCESRQRVFSMALIHERLYVNEQVSELDFGPYANTLVSELVYSYSRSAKISARVNVSSIRLSIDQAIPCGLILNELVTNAMKYAYPDDRTGEIKVDFSESAPNRLCLTVSDNGIGLPLDFNWKKSKSLGMSIVDILANQLEGTFSVQSNAGAIFTVDFPRRQEEDSLAA